MRVARFALALVLVACAGGGTSLVAPSVTPSPNAADAFPEPPVVASSNAVAHLALTAAINPATGAPGFLYQGAFVAPTIEVQPGDTIQIDYTNDLPISSSPPNVTNLHFHGMTVSPNAPADEVLLTLAEPGQTLHYNIPVPVDEQPGLYWYHPHPHGESDWQVENGMAGAIIVDGIEASVPSVASMRTRVLLLEDPQDQPNYATLLKGREAIAQRHRRHADSSPGSCGPERGRHVTINGLTSAQIGIQPGEQEFFRVVNASADRYFDLSVDGEQLQLVALDGFAMDTYPGNASTQTVGDVLIPPAGRAEFIVTGQRSPTTLRSACVDSGPDGDPDPAVALATFVNDAGSASSTATRIRRATRALLKNPFLTGPVPAPVAQRTITLTENVVTNEFFINGKAFDINDAPQIVSNVGTTEEWTVLNETDEVHAFHLHQVHFAVEAIDGVPQTSLHWVDTVNVPYATGGSGTQQPGSVKLLVDLRDPVIVGTFVYHCHILEHEDGGMMAKIQVR